MHHTPLHGVAGARDFWQHYRDTFESIESRFMNVVEAGNVAMLEWRSSGRATTGDDFSYGGVSVLEFDGEKVKRFRAYFDPAALGVQIRP